MRTLLIDNYDSFTWNLFHLLWEVNGVEPLVLQNDDHAGWGRLDRAQFDNVVLSPGPGRPERERDFGISRLLLLQASVPLLGVCLGHQGLCHVAGAVIERAPEPFHGRTSQVFHRGGPLFEGIPSPFRAVRYHSLLVRQLTDELELLATTADGLVMAVAHRSRPHFGVQFHPESIAAEFGRALLQNFRRLSEREVGERSESTQRNPSARPRAVAHPPGQALEVHTLELGLAPDPERAFPALCGDLSHAAWLDSSRTASDLGRFSIVCWPSAELGEVVRYDVVRREVVVERPRDGSRTCTRETLFDFLEREQQRRAVPDPGSPHPFLLGYVGTLGYELALDAGAVRAHRSALPDAHLLFCDRAFVYEHATQRGFLLALSESGDGAAARAWLARTERVLATLPPEAPERALGERAPGPSEPLCVPSTRLPAAEYERRIAECLAAIRSGESYELCLTQQLEVPFHGDPFAAYLLLRRLNPAPYAAYLRLGEVSLLSSSPERFLTIDRTGVAESRPIKGTARRAPDPDQDAALGEALLRSEKNRAENLMIVDLVRNDLGRVAQLGTVHVPRLFELESYARVHQLVSTVRARPRPEVSPSQCVRACFPPGSMTGAPKLRTMELLSELEGKARGAYSGALGYFSLNGVVDLSVVIRTIVLHRGVAQIGTGGAIVALSDAAAERAETELKAEVLLEVLARSAQ